MRVKVGETVLTPEHKKAVLKVLKSNQVSPGPVCREFESKFAAVHGAKYGLFVNSGTDALRIALLAMKELYGWKDGSSVIVPSCTFVATANVVLQANLKPVVVDVGMYDGCLNTHMLQRVLETSEDRPVCVVPVHLFGKIAELGHLLELKKKYGFKILEDSCESMGVCNVVGDASAYSTYVCHLISTGVGGLAITNNAKLNELMWSYANHGRRKSSNIEDRFVFERMGYSARATELQAALGLVELKHLKENIRRRRQIAEKLCEGLSGLPLMLPFFYSDTQHAFMMFPIVLKKGNKWDLCRYLEKRGIETRDYLNLGQPCYPKEFIGDHNSVMKDFKKNGFYIGCHPLMTDADVKYVVKTFKNYFAV